MEEKDYKEISSSLLSKRKELSERLSAIADSAGRGRQFDPDFEEQAVERQNEDVLNALDVAAQEEIAQISRALGRLERGEYGRCLSCGSEIPLPRLRAIPYTELCVQCAEGRSS